MIGLAFCLAIAFAGLTCVNQASAEDTAELSAAKQISVSLKRTGSYSGTSVTVDRKVYHSGDSVNLTWKSTTSGDDVIIPKSIKYGNKTISASELISADELQSANTEYKKLMKSDQTQTEFDTLASFVKKSHTVTLTGITVNTTITVEFAKVSPVYRLYNTVSSEHLFTTNKSEYEVLSALGITGQDFWVGEGINWLAPTTGNTVHRLYNKGLGSLGKSSHYYTADATEIAKLLKNGWKDDGASYQFKSGGAVAIYTCYNEALGSAHHYTSSKTEWLNLKNNGWDIETTKNGKIGVFQGVLATSWSFTGNYYRVQHVVDGQVQATQIVAGKAGNQTNAKAKDFAGYSAQPISKKKIASDNSTVVEINYSRNYYHVTFQANNGSVNNKVNTVQYKAKVNELAMADQVDKTFEGWYLDSNFKYKYNFSTSSMPAGDLTLYAKWKDKELVTYRVFHRFQKVNGDFPTEEGGEDVIIETFKGKVGSTTQAVAKTATGFTVEEFSQKTLTDNITSEFTNDIDIRYERNTYRLVFNLNGYGKYVWNGEGNEPYIGEQRVEYRVRYGELIDLTSIRQGLSDDTKYFAGWYTAKDYTKGEHWGHGGTTEITMPDRMVTLYARWTDTPTHWLVFETNGGTPIVSEEVVQGTNPSKPADGATARTGYTFIGWYSNQELTVSFRFDKTLTDDTTAYAKWQGNPDIKYTVRHVKQNVDGTWDNAEYEDTTCYGTAGEGATYTAKEIEGFHVDSAQTKVIEGDGSTVIEVRYARNVHTFHIDVPDNIDQPEDQQVLYGAEPKQPSLNVRDDYSLDGYYKDSNYTERFYWILNTMPDSDVTVYAKVSFIYSYWIAPASKTTTANTHDGADQINPSYTNPEKGYIKTQQQIDRDVKAIRNGNSTVIAEYQGYLRSDRYHLYVKWRGSTVDDSGAANEENSYVEFRIIAVGSHDGDGSALTFQATHALPEAYSMNKTNTNVGSWSGSSLRKLFATGSDIYSNFDSSFVSKIRSVSKKTTAGNKSTTVKSTSEKFWLLSYSELTGKSQSYENDDTGETISATESTQYTYYSRLGIVAGDSAKDPNNYALLRKTRAGNKPANQSYGYNFWWTRSPNIQFKYTFLAVNYGNADQHMYASSKLGVVPAFCF